MGGGSSTIEYAVPVSEKKKGETPIYRGPNYKDGLKSGPAPEVNDMKKALLTAISQFGKNNCLGTIIRKEGQQDKI